MSSLAKTTQKLRYVIKIGAIIAGVIFLIYLFITGGIFFKDLFFPAAPETPKQAFGELPTLGFSSHTSQINYQINTVSGELPTFPDRMFVYRLDPPRPDLLALQNARRIAANEGFTDQETEVSETLYEWTNPSSNAVLQYNIGSNNFEIKSNYISSPNQNLLTNSGFPEEDRIKRDVSQFLNSLNVNLEGLTFRDNSIEYLSIANNSLQPVDNIFNAKVVRISLYHNNIENDLGTFPFVYPEGKALVNIVASFPSSLRMIVFEGESYDHSVLMNEYSGYPIKTAAEAFEELQNGGGYLFNPNDQRSIQITDVYLAYYLDKETMEFAQPVIVFESANATAYVPAIKIIQSTEETSK